MTSGTCTRCGAVGQVEYGSDGLAYCSSCAFYGLNKQCWRCRMYLPAAELQQYRGQFTCPYCIQDLRDADRKAEEYAPAKEKPHHLDLAAYSETCDRCNRELKGHVYIWNNQKLCRNCLQEEQGKWTVVGGGPMATPYKISLEPEKKRKKASFIEAVISGALHLIGGKGKKSEVTVYETKMPISRARPMTEKPMAPAARVNEISTDVGKVEAEGIIKKKAERPFELERPMGEGQGNFIEVRQNSGPAEVDRAKLAHVVASINSNSSKPAKNEAISLSNQPPIKTSPAPLVPSAKTPKSAISPSDGKDKTGGKPLRKKKKQ